MAKKNSHSSDRYVDQRTRSLATVYLTRRDDLVVTEAEKETGVDLRVMIETRKEAAGRPFGVLLRGTVTDLTAEHANSILNPSMDAFSVRAFPFPVCLFFFRMENDRGYYTWVAEPIVSTKGSPGLRYHNEAACANLDTEAVNEIVEAVNAWYDAFTTNVLEGAGNHRKKSGIQVLHGIIDGEALYFSEHGKPPRLLRLPIGQAYELAKLGREHLGDLAGQIIKDGVEVLEKGGLLGVKVKLVTDQSDFSFE